MSHEPSNDPELNLYVERAGDGSYPDVALERQKLAENGVDVRRSALCFSGGGIRSATFCLGVLQSMAKIGWLNQFTYLSTVSGGGYIGSWLTSWIRRRGLAAVESALSNASGGEAKEIRQLRSGSNYLSPTTGLSGDSLALFGTFVRNLLINWALILPLLVAAMLIPMVNVGIVDDVLHSPARWVIWQSIFLYGAIGTALLGLAYTASDLPNGTVRQTRHNYFLLGAFVPVITGCYLLSLALANDQLVTALNRVYDNLVPSTRNLPRHYLYGGLGALIHVVGVWIGRLLLMKKREYFEPLESRDFKGEIGAKLPAPIKVFAISVLSGGVAGYAVYGCVTAAAQAREALSQMSPETWSAIYATVSVPVLLLCYSLGSVLYLALLRRNSDEGAREWWSRAGGIWLLTALVWVLVHLVAIWLPGMLSRMGALTTGGIGTLGGVLVAVAGYKSRQDATKKASSGTSVLEALNVRVLDLVAVAFLVAMFVTCAILIVDSTTQLEYPKHPELVFPAFLKGVTEWPIERFCLAVICVAVSFAFAWFTGVNAFSMHSMYGNRLARAYLGATRDGAPPDGSQAQGQQRRPHAFTGFDPDDEISMSDWGNGPKNKLFHVINIALNIMRPSGNHLEWQERKAASFTVTPIYTGSQVTGYCRTRSVGGRGTTGVTTNKLVSGLTVGRAMTISGAAVSPSMGYHSSKLIAIVMTFFNVRLGWWLPNPGRIEAAAKSNVPLETIENDYCRTEPSFPLYSLLSEMFGNTTSESKSIYLSDGGHFENLGLYEMVRRECLEIVVVDAGCDPEYVFEDLERAIRVIRNDLGAEITFPHGLPTEESIEATGRSYTIGHVRYRSGEVGLLLYIKPGLDGTEPLDVTQYAARVRANGEPFPHQSTADQFFDEPQFESYRALGQHSIANLSGVGPLDLEAIETTIIEEDHEREKERAREEFGRAATRAMAGASESGDEAEGSGKKILEAIGGLFSWDKLPGLLATALGVTAGAATLAKDPAAEDQTAIVDAGPGSGVVNGGQAGVGNQDEPGPTTDGEQFGGEAGPSITDPPPSDDPLDEGTPNGGKQPGTADAGTGGGNDPAPIADFPGDGHGEGEVGPTQPPFEPRTILVRGFGEARICKVTGPHCDDGWTLSSATIRKLRALDAKIGECGPSARRPFTFTIRGYASTSDFKITSARGGKDAPRIRHPDSDWLNLSLADSRARAVTRYLPSALAINSRKSGAVVQSWLDGLTTKDKPELHERLLRMRRFLEIDTADDIYDPVAAGDNRRIDIRITSPGGCDMVQLRRVMMTNAEVRTAAK